MSGFVDKTSRRIAKTPEGVALYLRELNQQGITIDEISRRVGLNMDVTRGLINGTRRLPRQLAASLAQDLNRLISNGSFVIRIPASGGKIVSLEPASQDERDKARDYLDELRKFRSGQRANMSQFKGVVVRVRGSEGAEKFLLVTDEQTLREMARKGMLSEIRYWRNMSS